MGVDPEPRNGGVRVVPVTRADVPVVLAFVRELATYERAPSAVTASEADLDAALFGPHPAAEALLAWVDDEPVGFALFFHNFSTWTGKRGLFLEDLYVRPQARGHGVGRALMAVLARLAADRECHRLEWIVLDWNAPARAFYLAIGAHTLDDWTTCRLERAALHALATDAPG
jgi:GNAT superfamily N-acetyltransferase